MEQMAINGATPFIPEGIMSNILKRLPVKSLLRFRCVCKHWKNLFKTPSFIQDHLHHSTHHNSSLLIGPNNRDDEFYLLSLSWELQFREFEIAPLIGSLIGLYLVGSSDGLLCFADWSTYHPPNIHYPSPLLWNPATREVRRVPIISDDFSYLGWHFGFGFNPIINDYRIVRLSLSPRVSKVEVYSLSTGCWRNIEFDKIKDVSTIGHGVTANGVMFWYGLKHVVDTQYTDVMVSFDLATEVFTVISWPSFSGYYGKLAVNDDKLAIISYPKTEKDKHDFSSLYFEVMKEGDMDIDSSRERWSSSEKYIGNSKIPLYNGTFWRNQIVTIDYGVQTFTEHGDEFMNHLYLIDVHASECKQFDIPRPKAGLGVCVFNYVESLVPVSGIIQIEEP